MMMIANRHDDADMQASLQMVDTSGTLGQSTCSFGAPVILDLPVIPPRAYWPDLGQMVVIASRYINTLS